MVNMSEHSVFRRRQTKVRKKTKYTILDNMDEQERVELRPKFSESLHLNLFYSQLQNDSK